MWRGAHHDCRPSAGLLACGLRSHLYPGYYWKRAGRHSTGLPAQVRGQKDSASKLRTDRFVDQIFSLVLAPGQSAASQTGIASTSQPLICSLSWPCHSGPWTRPWLTGASGRPLALAFMLSTRSICTVACSSWHSSAWTATWLWSEPRTQALAGSGSSWLTDWFM